MVSYPGALFCGPEADSTRFYACPMPTSPSGDFAIFMLMQPEKLWVGDPQVNASNVINYAQSYVTGGTGGNDSHLRINPRNVGTAADRGKVVARLVVAGNNILSTGSFLQGSSVLNNSEPILVVLQSRAGAIELKTCKPGGAAVTEATGTRNGVFTALALGTWFVGRTNVGGYVQALGVAAQSFSDAELASIAGGADLDGIVASGNRLALWLFSSTAASIASSWGAVGAATRNGTWTQQTAASPVIPTTGDARLTVTNQPIVYGAVSVDDDGSGRTHTWTGTYTGFTPTTFQGRLEALDGATIADWTDLGSFTASAGTWSGTMEVPPGGLYRLQVRDKTDTAKIWRGGNPWNCSPVLLTIGQSQHAYFEGTYKGKGPAITADLYVCWATVPNQMVKANSGIVGAGLAYLANAWGAASGGLPLTAVLASAAGTSSTNWKDKSATTWPPMLAGLGYLNPQRVLAAWLQGTSDAGFTAATIKANLDAILANFDADVTGTRGIGYRFMVLPHNRDTGNTPNNGKVRVAQYEWARDHAQAGSKVLIGPWWADMQTDTEITGTARAATSTSITLAADDPATGTSVYTGQTITIVSGTGAGQARTISAYDITTKVATVSTAWTTVPDATSVYRMTGSSPHPTVIGAMDRFGPRYARDLARKWGFAAVGGRGPSLAAATYPTGGDGSILDVAATHRYGTALATAAGGQDAAGVAGFQVSDDNFATTKTITAAAITDADTVRLTLAAPPSNLAGLKVRYGAQEPVPTASWHQVEAFGLADLLGDDTGGLAEFTTADLAATEAVPPPPEPGAVIVVGGTLVVVGGTLTIAA